MTPSLSWAASAQRSEVKQVGLQSQEPKGLLSVDSRANHQLLLGPHLGGPWCRLVSRWDVGR